MKLPLILLSICAVLALGACGDDDSNGETTAGGEATTTAESGEAAGAKTKPTVEVPDGPPPRQLKTEDLEEGSGPRARSGDEVTVQYVGVNYESGEEFDSSWDAGQPFTFPLGAGEVIPGWDQGVQGMKAGGRRELVIPPDLGYGETGAPPDIPPNETLVFVVDLVEIG